MTRRLPFGHYVNGANTIDITVRMTKGDDGRNRIDLQRCFLDKDLFGRLNHQDVRFDAERFGELRDAVETIARHMDQALEQGATES